jgi:hypothetical protein
VLGENVQEIGTMYIVGFTTDSLVQSNDLKDYLKSGKIVIKMGTVEEIKKGNRVIFSDGSQAHVESIILCTGYNYTFPFLENSTDNLV